MTKSIAKSAWELEQLLIDRYGERFDPDFLSTLRGGVSGSFDSKRFHITYACDKYLLISTSPDGRAILDELLPTLTEVMGNASPICSYDLQNIDMDENFVEPTIEWDVVEPEKRIKDIVNGRAFSDGAKTINIKLYNGKNVSDYVESEQEKEERIKNAKIYGIYPGCIKDVESVNNLSEVDLYFMIDAMGITMWNTRHAMSHGRIPEVDFTEAEYAMEYMAYQTTKFGVELPEPQIDRHITPTPSYQAWYRFYANHFKETLTNEQWNEFLEAQKKGEDTSAYMPSGHWTDLLKNTEGKTHK